MAQRGVFRRTAWFLVLPLYGLFGGSSLALFHRSTTLQTRVGGLWATPVHRCSSQMTSTHRAAARVAFVYQEEVVCRLWRRLLEASASRAAQRAARY